MAIAAFLGLAISVIVLWKQATSFEEQNRRLSDALVHQGKADIDAYFQEIARAFLDYPHLRQLFHPDEFDHAMPQLTPADRSRATTIAEMTLDAYEASVLAEAVSGRDDVSLTWLPYMVDVLRTSDFVYEQLQQRASWYPLLLPIANQARPPKQDE